MYNQDLRGKPQSEVFKNSIDQLGRELSQFFVGKRETPTFLLKADDDLKDIRNGERSEEFAIPFFTYKLDTQSDNKSLYNNNTLRRMGIRINTIRKPEPGERIDDPNQVYRTHHLTPLDLSFNVEYVCSYDDQYLLGPLWAQAAQGHYLNFQMELGESLLSFKIELSTDLTYATIDFDNSRYVRCATSLVMTTYHGVVSNVKPFNSYRVDTGLVSKTNKDAELVPSLEVKKSKSTTFTVKHNDGDR